VAKTISQKIELNGNVGYGAKSRTYLSSALPNQHSRRLRIANAVCSANFVGASASMAA
jgi:hypothetical protein